MRNPPRQERECTPVGGHRPRPELARVLPRNECARVIERHDDHDQPAIRVDRGVSVPSIQNSQTKVYNGPAAGDGPVVTRVAEKRLLRHHGLALRQRRVLHRDLLHLVRRAPAEVRRVQCLGDAAYSFRLPSRILRLEGPGPVAPCPDGVICLESDDRRRLDMGRLLSGAIKWRTRPLGSRVAWILILQG